MQYSSILHQLILTTGSFQIPLVYPSFAHPGATPSTRPHPSLTQLQALLANRKPLHRKGFYTWMIIAPFTAPFMVVRKYPSVCTSFPTSCGCSLLQTGHCLTHDSLLFAAIIPNIPFFFCVWRSWSHYRGLSTYVALSIARN